MAIQIGAKPESSFREPLGLLQDCHRRIERFLDQLRRLAPDASTASLDADRRGALDTALRYFRGAAPLHTADEEQSLFPRLRASGRPQAAHALVALERLEADHRAADTDHAEVDRLGSLWLECGVLAAEEAMELREALDRLHALYQRHIAVEDGEVFPAAADALSAEALRSLGDEMARRRGLDPDVQLPAGRCVRRAQGEV